PRTRFHQLANMAIMSILVSAIIAITLGAAYIAGLLDPVIEQVGVMFFRAKAKGEEKKMEARGMKEGQDFFEGELKGNKQAEDVKEGLGELKTGGSGLYGTYADGSGVTR
ncbi:hypothetical protein LHYA1_G005543, partial [Lachnellula hyalina]